MAKLFTSRYGSAPSLKTLGSLEDLRERIDTARAKNQIGRGVMPLYVWSLSVLTNIFGHDQVVIKAVFGLICGEGFTLTTLRADRRFLVRMTTVDIPR